MEERQPPTALRIGIGHIYHHWKNEAHSGAVIGFDSHIIAALHCADKRSPADRQSEGGNERFGHYRTRWEGSGRAMAGEQCSHHTVLLPTNTT